MDDIKPGQSVDGFSKTNQPTGAGGYSSQSVTNEPTDTNPSISDHQQYQVHTSAPKSGKGLKIALILFIILFLAASAFAYLEYSKATQLQKDLDAANAALKQAQQQVDSLTYDSKDLAKKATMSSEQAQTLYNTAVQLKKTCGKSCEAVVIVKPN